MKVVSRCFSRVLVVWKGRFGVFGFLSMCGVSLYLFQEFYNLGKAIFEVKPKISMVFLELLARCKAKPMQTNGMCSSYVPFPPNKQQQQQQQKQKVTLKKTTHTQIKTLEIPRNLI